MATDFFERQSTAQRSTSWLVSMFLLAVIGIVGSVYGVTAVVLNYQRSNIERAIDQPFPWSVPLFAAVTTLILILGGTIFKILQLRKGGGTEVAEHLGGVRIFPNTSDPTERRLLNVVEEMAIASGTPVPPVFYLENESGINAFAAGYSPSDAVIGVTRGCAENLSRDELQGVIAHEFSHILNGDMRMSIRLIGVLNGILLLGLMGQLMFRMVLYSGHGRSRSRRSNGSSSGQIVMVLLLIGVTLVVIGFIGTIFGNLIKAAVSRQREFLADASAVQFTRNPQGIAGALQRIGGLSVGSRLVTPAAAEASHMYFSKGVWEGFAGLWATHPPLAKRIRAIDPNWNGEFLATEGDGHSTPSAKTAAGFVGAIANDSGETEIAPALMDHIADHVGDPTKAHREYAAKLLASISQQILRSARETYGARAVMFCLLLDHEEDVREHQFGALKKHAREDVLQLTYQLAPLVDQLETRARLPLVDLTIPSLRAMTPSQFKDFDKCFSELVRADNRLDLFEWMLSQILNKHLRPQFEPVSSPRIQYYGLQRLGEPCSTLLSTVAFVGHSDDVAAQAFATGAKHLSELSLQLKARNECGMHSLLEALHMLRTVSAKHRGRLIDACAATICADEHVTTKEAELLRGIADLLDCPMPPVLPN